MILAETDIGFLAFEGNELTIGSKVDDPPKVRLTSPTTAHGGGGGVVSFSRSRQAGVVCMGGQQVEMGFVRVEQSEAVRGDAGNPRGEFNILLNAGGEEDHAMQRSIAIECDRVTKVNGNLLAALLGGASGGGGSPSRFVSPNGRWWLQMQDDGNYVIYDAADPSKPKAVFDLWWLMEALAELGKAYGKAAGV